MEIDEHLKYTLYVSLVRECILTAAAYSSTPARGRASRWSLGGRQTISCRWLESESGRSVGWLYVYRLPLMERRVLCHVVMRLE